MPTQKKLSTSKYLYIIALVIALVFLCFAFNFLYARHQNQTATSIFSNSNQLEFDFTTLQGKQNAVKTYIKLHNELGKMEWLPFDMDFGYSRGWSIARHAVENVFFPLIIEKKLVKGPTCLDWSTRYIGSTFKDICTNPYSIYYEKHYCGGNFGQFTEGRHGFCADIHQTRGIIPDNMFDMVLSTMVFEHLTNPWVAASNVYNMIKPGGVFVFIAPQISIFHEFPNHYYGFTVQGAVFMLQQAGFCIKYAHGITSSFSCMSHVMGFATKDIDRNELNKMDDIAPCLIGVVAVKPEKQGDPCPQGDYPSATSLGQFRKEWGKRVKAEMSGNV